MAMMIGRYWKGLATFPNRPSLASVRGLVDDVLDDSSPPWWYVVSNVVIHLV
jgi:hypothetical protein